MLHIKLIDWFNSQTMEVQAVVVLFILQQLATLIVGALPQKYADRWWAKILGRAANAKFSDARGTWKLPGMPAHDVTTTVGQ